MIVTCPECGRAYDDAAQWTICPHRNLGDPPTDGKPMPMKNGGSVGIIDSNEIRDPTMYMSRVSDPTDFDFQADQINPSQENQTMTEPDQNQTPVVPEHAPRPMPECYPGLIVGVMQKGQEHTRVVGIIVTSKPETDGDYCVATFGDRTATDYMRFINDADDNEWCWYHLPTRGPMPDLGLPASVCKPGEHMTATQVAMAQRAQRTPPTMDPPTPGRNILIVVAKGGQPDPEHAPLPGGAIGIRPDGRLMVDVWAWEREVGGPRSFLHVSECPDGAFGWDWMSYQVGQAKKVEEVAERRMGMVRTPTTHELAARFTYHAPKPGQPAMYEAIREKARDLATIMGAYCPPSDELAKALDHLDNAVFNANAAIARHGGAAR